MEALDERIIIRRLTEPVLPNKSHARLSLGPRLHTRIAAVAQSLDNGKQRTVSTESQATLCAGDAPTENLLSPKSKASDDIQHVGPSSQTMHALKTFRRGSPSGGIDQVTALDRDTVKYSRESRHRRRQTAPSNHTIHGLDGANDTHTASRSASAVPVPLHDGRPVFQELPFLSGGSSSADRRLLSSARTQRPRLSSHDDPLTIHEDHVFDPNATVFTPRVRLSSTVVVSDADANRPSITRERMQPGQSSVDLWVRSSSEQNMDPSHRHRLQQDFAAERDEEEDDIPEPALLSPRLQHGRVTSSRQRRLSENSTRPLPSPNLDRYPLLLPATSSGGGRRRSGSGRSDTSQTGEASSRQASRPDEVSPLLNTTSPQPDSNRPDSPTLAVASLSSPLFLHSVSPGPAFHQRSSSLAWREDAEAVSPKTRPGLVTSSPASGISALSTSHRSLLGRHASGELADAAAEFLRARSSPLDRLTAELGRLSATLSSCGPGTPSEKSVRLLNGDPFRQSVSPPRERALSVATSHGSPERDTTELRSLGPMHTGEASLPIENTASPPRPAFELLPSLPTTPLPPSTSPSHPQLPRSADKKHNPSTVITTTPAPPLQTIPSTPKLPVYSDATPAHLQPQTPADLLRASRRLRNRSESAVVQQEIIFVGRALVSPALPPVPERRTFRNTYPSALPAVSGVVDDVQLLRQRSVQQLAANLRLRDDEEGENDVEGQLVGLEGDRRVWLERRGEDGGLEVTPPAEGRFERFLS